MTQNVQHVQARQQAANPLSKATGNFPPDDAVIEGSVSLSALWGGIIGTELNTGNINVFDACSYYAHNEMEIGMWRTGHHRMRAKVCKDEYLRNMKPSEMGDQWDDRNRLYGCKTRFMYSTHVPESRDTLPFPKSELRAWILAKVAGILVQPDVGL